MKVYDLLEKINPIRVAEIESSAAYEWEDIDADELAAGYMFFLDNLMKLDVSKSESDGIIIALPRYGEGKPYVAAEMCKRSALKNYMQRDVDASEVINRIKECKDYRDEEKLGEAIRNLQKLIDVELYGYEFSPWEETLAAGVIPTNINRYDIDEFGQSLLFELSFNGITRESQDERREELEKSVAEVEHFMELPEEERDKHLVSLNTLRDELDLKDERSEIEKKNDMFRLLMDSALTYIAKYEELEKIREDIKSGKVTL